MFKTAIELLKANKKGILKKVGLGAIVLGVGGLLTSALSTTPTDEEVPVEEADNEPIDVEAEPVENQENKEE
jgi:hypothetical protein